MWMELMLAQEEIDRSVDEAEAAKLLVFYHLFQTAIFIGEEEGASIFGDRAAFRDGDIDAAPLVVPAADFTLAWMGVFEWLDADTREWRYEHPDNDLAVVLRRGAGGSVRISFDDEPNEFIETTVDELREVLSLELFRFATVLAPLLGQCSAEDAEQALEEMDAAFEAADERLASREDSDA